ncbi:MAG: hemolysin family protein, partial [Aeoliella sp.]
RIFWVAWSEASCQVRIEYRPVTLYGGSSFAVLTLGEFKMLQLTFIIVLFIAFSALMALIEAALLSISHGEVEELRIQKVWGATALKSLTGRLTLTLVVVVVITNLINILGPILASRKAIQLYGDSAIVFVTVILTLGTIVFSEIIPKSLGSHYAPRIAPLVAPLIRSLVYVLYPLAVVLEWISSLLKSGERQIGTEVQIRSLVTQGRRAGLIEADEGRMIRRAFVLNDRTAEDIMTPISQVAVIKDSATVREAASVVLHHAYSRYPVFGKSVHDVTGLVMSRDIFEALTDGKDDVPISSISTPCLTVSTKLRSDALLVRFRDRRIHLAVVRDHERSVGVVTLEDVLEELVGEIEDEKDTAR